MAPPVPGVRRPWGTVPKAALVAGTQVSWSVSEWRCILPCLCEVGVVEAGGCMAPGAGRGDRQVPGDQARLLGKRGPGDTGLSPLCPPQDFLRSFSPDVFRLFCVRSHYRSGELGLPVPLPLHARGLLPLLPPAPHIRVGPRAVAIIPWPLLVHPTRSCTVGAMAVCCREAGGWSCGRPVGWLPAWLPGGVRLGPWMLLPFQYLSPSAVDYSSSSMLDAQHLLLGLAAFVEDSRAYMKGQLAGGAVGEAALWER